MNKYTRINAVLAGALALGATNSVFAQDPNYQPPSTGGWHRFSETGRPPAAAEVPGPSAQDEQAPPPAPAPSPAPPTLTLPAGAWITVRIDQPLASNHNQPGDTFTGTLIQPMVANGRVIARRGQMVAGRVVEASTAKRGNGQSRLGIEITEISLVDGRHVPVKTQWIERRGDSSAGENAAAIGVTTGMGAAIGAAAAGGYGAGLGAIAGAGASVIGVLLSNGKPAVVYPETPLTFRVEAPVTITTQHAEYAFEPVGREDYMQSPSLRQGPPRQAGPPPAYYGAPYAAPYPYPYAYSPYSYVPFGFGVYIGPRHYYGHGYYRRW